MNLGHFRHSLTLLVKSLSARPYTITNHIFFPLTAVVSGQLNAFMLEALPVERAGLVLGVFSVIE